MKTLILVFVFYVCSSFINIRTVSSNTTITSTDNDGIVMNTGGAVTFTLGSVSSGFSCSVVNNGTGNITFSSGITVANGQTITVLTKSATEISPGLIGNKIRIFYNGSTWRSY